MTINYNSITIEMTKAESKAAGKFGSETYKELTTIMQQFPTFTIKVSTRASVKKSSEFKGLTYSYMEAYIARHDNENQTIMAEYKMLRGKSDEAKEVLADSLSYQEIKKWFLAQFNEIEEFHQKRQNMLAPTN